MDGIPRRDTIGADTSKGSEARRKRWPFVVGAVALFIAGALVLIWFAWLPSYRPELHTNEQYGIDVSHHQGPIDWERVAEDGMSFAFIKATEGSDFVDPRFDENWIVASQAGLDRGAYHFFSLCTSGHDQARNFLRTVPDDSNALPPALDLELSGNCDARPSRGEVLAELSTFLRLVEASASDRAILYVRDDFEELYRVRGYFGRPLWQPRFLVRPDIDGWLIWQVGSFARIDGISGRVDLNIMRCDGNADPRCLKR